MRRLGTTFLIVSLVVLSSATSAAAGPRWRRQIDRIVRKASMGVAVRYQGQVLYERNAQARRIPASNEKLMLSMALFDALDPTYRLSTVVAAAGTPREGTVFGDLYILGRGDPAIGNGGRWSKSLPFKPTRVSALARKLDALGVTRISGRVIGSTGYFARDHWATGWKANFPSEEVALPTALALEGNVYRGYNVDNPEWRAARALTKRLRARGVSVGGRPQSAAAPASLVEIAHVRSRPLKTLVSYMNRESANFFAEMFAKRLGIERSGRPGTIAKGAAAIDAWARSVGPDIDAFDGSGLSSSNRVSPLAMTRLLQAARAESWGNELRRGLPKAGQGTLEDRLNAVRVRAKTGTLDGISTLSGWIWLRRVDDWAEFSIMSSGLYKGDAVEREDAILRVVTRSAN